MDRSISTDQRTLQAVARDFASEELAPVSVAFDNQAKPRDCFPADLVVAASKLGLRTMKIPKELGGHGVNCFEEVLVQEELCTGDVGFGMTMQHAWREGYAIAVLGTQVHRERHLDEFMSDDSYLTSYAMTEAHFGSDASGASADPADGPRSRAVLDQGTWHLTGQKLWVTNASLARLVLILCRTDSSVPWREGTTWFVVSTDNPGYQVGRVEDKLGIRLNQNAEIVLDDCQLDEESMIGELNAAPRLSARMAAGSRVKTGAKCLGVARACLEETHAYLGSGARLGGVGRQAIQSELADMAISIGAARALIWQAAEAVDAGRPEASRLETMAKLNAAACGNKVAQSARTIVGSDAMVRGTRMEKLLRDAACLMHLGGGLHAGRTHLETAHAV